MSDYDFQQSQTSNSDRMGYGQDRPGTALWAGIGIIALVLLVGALFIGAGSGTGDGTAPATEGTAAPAGDAAPASGTN